MRVAPPRHEPVCTHQFNCNFVSAPLHSVVRDVTYALSARQCAASTTNWGVRPRSGIDLSTIVVLGGSVSCNRNVGNRTDADASAEPQAPDAPLADSGWPQQLAAILRWCGEQSVKVVNLCKGSTGTDYWLNRLRFDRAVRDATVVIVETANNDADHEQTEVLTEAMVRRLRELPKRPFMLWLAASFNREWHTSAELRQLKIVREYGVGQVSVLNALRPSRDAATQAFIGDVYFQDGIHPSKLGHRLLASITAAHILQQLQPINESVASVGGHAAELIPSAIDAVRSPFFVHTAARALWKQQQRPPRLVADLAVRALCAHGGDVRTAPALLTEHSHGFAFAEDVPGQCGLIAKRPGSRVVFRLPANVTGVLLGFLSSYAHNGLMRVTLTQQRHGCEEQQSTATSSALVLDTLTSTVERRVSVYAERYLQGALPMGVKTDCSWLEVRVLKAKDRDEHKIKLLQLVAD